MALAVGCRINTTSVFARKNYFYPDLPKGYQISQYDLPIALEGRLPITTSENDASTEVRVERIHMEEDAGKLLHDGFADADRFSGVDFNRSGTPLIEIVSHPDMTSPEQAVAYAQKIRSIARYAGVSDADMEKGNLRCDGNISIRLRGETALGPKVELKNLNSFRFLGQALAFEAERQAAVLDGGGRVVQETRLYDPDAHETRTMRSKEDAEDYRYFPEPDLPPLTLDSQWMDDIRRDLPELSDARRDRLIAEYGLPPYDAEVLTNSREMADYFEKAVGVGASAKTTSNWIMSEVLRLLNEEGGEIEDFKIPPESLGEMVRLIDDGTISGKMAKDIFEKMYSSGSGAREIVEREGLSQISDLSELERMAREVVDANPQQVQDLKSGKAKVIGWLVGQVMKMSRGKANPALAKQALQKILDED